jgi:cytochrome P450
MTATAIMEPSATPAPSFIPPGPKPLPRDPSLLATLRLSFRNSIEAWPRAVYEQRVYKLPLPGLPLLVMDPALIRAIFVEQSDCFTQGDLFRRMLGPIWGRGLATATGADWRWQRRAAAPAFRAAALTSLAPRVRGAAEAALARWTEAGDGAVLDIAQETARVTFDVILDTMLSGGEDIDRTTARARIEAFVSQLRRIRATYYFAPDKFHRGREDPETAEARSLRADVQRMIERRRHLPPRGDLVDLLMEAADPETGRAMDDETLRDNLLGFIVAGHETSAVALAWALYLVSEDPRTLERIRSEVTEATGGGPVEAVHVERLAFTRQVVQEAMRLYPPAHSLIRVCTKKTRVGDFTIRPGGRIVIPVYALHRHRLWWRDPDAFDPDRFAPSQPHPDRHLYMPFGAGPRICIGAAFAMTELVVLLATLVRHASFSLVPGHPVWPLAGLALTPEHGLPMRIRLHASDRAAA